MNADSLSCVKVYKPSNMEIKVKVFRNNLPCDFCRLAPKLGIAAESQNVKPLSLATNNVAHIAAKLSEFFIIAARGKAVSSSPRENNLLANSNVS